jgi:hypothetical protein
MNYNELILSEFELIKQDLIKRYNEKGMRASGNFESSLEVKWTNQPAQTIESPPGSGEGLKVLTILVEKVRGKLIRNCNNLFEVRLFIPLNQ